MNIPTKISILFFFASALAGCGAEYGEVYYEDSYYEDSYYDSYTETTTVVSDIQVDTVVEHPVDIPRLKQFHMIDSYGVNTETQPNIALAVNPYTDDGYFDIYWYAESWDDYWVEYYISDNPSMDGAQYVGSEMCGVGLECEEDGLQFCQYTADFYLQCDTGEDVAVDLVPMMYAVPQTLYFILQVCDLYFENCEYAFYPVLFE